MKETSITRTVLVVLLCALGAGCATRSKIPPFTYEGPSATQQSRDQTGLRVIADPFFDSGRCKTYFDTATVDDGLAVFFVRFENVGASATFLLRKESFRFGVMDAEGTATTTVDRGTGGGDAVMLTGAALGSLPLLFLGGAASTHAERIKHNFAEKELRNQTVGPGASAQGFVYYKLPKADLKSKSLLLTIPAVNTANQETNTFRFTLRYENNKTAR